MNRTLLNVAILAVGLAASAAKADWNHWGHGSVSVTVPQPQAQGHYEVRTVRRWVPGRYDQVWVQGVCYGHRWQRRCTPGGYQNVWRPGGYQDVQENVWVAAPAPCNTPRYGVSVGQPQVHANIVFRH